MKKLFEREISIYESLFDVDSNHVITVGQALSRIKKGKSRDKVEHVRRLPHGKERDSVKKSLPSPLFSGVFKSRNDNNIISYTGLICLDFDKCNIKDKIAELKKNKYVVSCWVSPSGNGVKALVEVSEPHRHLEHFDALLEDFKDLDQTGRNLSRVCFESYDPNIYIARKWEVYDRFIVKTYDAVPVVNTTQNTVYERLKKWMVNKGEGFFEGNRNNFVFKLTCGCLRFGLGKDEVRDVMINDFCGGSFHVKELDVILNSVYRNYASDFGTAQFTEDDHLISTVTKESIEEELENLEGPLEDVIYLNDIMPEMLSSFHSGDTEGETTYFPCIDDRWRWCRGEITVMFGIANYGKTEIILQLMLIKSIRDGYKWAIFSPENYPPVSFYNQLIHTLVGKSVHKHHKNQMSEDEYRKAAEKINKHFFFIYPDEKAPTQEYINRKFVELMVKENIDGCLIDPFNALVRDFGSNVRDDQYLQEFFRTQKKFTLENNIYTLIIMHPNGSIAKDERTGDYRAPGVYNIAGGAMTLNKTDNLLLFHRPYYNSNPSDTTSQFFSKKIKKKNINGNTGECILTYDVFERRFYDGDYTPFNEEKTAYVVPESGFSSAMEQARLPYANEKDEEVPY